MTAQRVQYAWIIVLVGFLGSALVPVYGTEEQGANVPATMASVDPTALEHRDRERRSTHDTQPQLGEEESLVMQLRARGTELEKREQKLREAEERMAGLHRDLEALAEQQRKAAEAINARDGKKEEKEGEDLTQKALVRLVKVYEAMDPEDAALRISEMNERLALDILAGIKTKRAASVLAGVEPKKAARLSAGLRIYRPKKSQTRTEQ